MDPYGLNLQIWASGRGVSLWKPARLTQLRHGPRGPFKEITFYQMTTTKTMVIHLTINHYNLVVESLTYPKNLCLTLNISQYDGTVDGRNPKQPPVIDETLWNMG